MSVNTVRSWLRHSPILIAIGVSLVVAVYVASMWPDAKDLAFADKLDALAEVGSLIAVVWLIAGYFQQGINLNATSKALLDQ